MTKELYTEEVMDLVDEMLTDINHYDDYELSVANESDNLDRCPILIIEFPDESSRAYDIPYRKALVDNLEHANELNVSEFINTIKNEIIEFENSYIEEENEEESYDDEYDEDEYDEDEEEYNNDYDDYEDIPELFFDYDEEDEYDEEDIEELENDRLEDSLNHSDDWYEDYDTDFEEEFTNVAKEWIEDYTRYNNVLIDITDIDFRELNNVYQNNDLSFRETMESVINKYIREHSEDWYEDYDTDYEDEFKEVAKQYIRDNKNNINMDEEELIEFIDFRELNNIYQNNDLSFRETMITELSDLRVLESRIMETLEEDRNIIGNEIPNPPREITNNREAILNRTRNWRDIKDRIYVVAYPKDEDVTNIYSYPLYDLNIGYIIDLDNCGVKVTDEMINNWGVTPRVLSTQVENNMIRDLQLTKIEDMMLSLNYTVNSRNNNNTTYVANLSSIPLGAGVITVIDKISEKLGNKNLYILPSSTEELLIIPTNTLDNEEEIKEFKNMVKEVNDECGLRDDNIYLSDDLYLYNSINKSCLVVKDIDNDLDDISRD